MKKNQTVICPVCGKFSFSMHNNHEICKYCGWENENYYDCGGANELSLNDSKKRYQDAIEHNPDFIWRNDGYSEE